ncbi:hypothetical protein E8E12_008738 [Didymella heteroderae]|uniref:Uncharacterized protein n=1 Tax=Didymella heteroderae TaxID=1769908 RepID=A0A9P4WTG9_9PLEO|nr:hypothetical protein E8E12_008738 [Didymella heteroderae]
MLRTQLDQSQRQLCVQECQYRDLREKYDIQLGQRRADFDKIADAYRRHQGSQTYSRKLKTELKATARVKDRQISRLKRDHHASMSVTEGIHHKELGRLNEEIEEFWAQLRAKEKQFAQAEDVRQDAIDVRVTVLASELAQKDRKIQELEAVNAAKGDALNQTKGAKEDMQRKLRKTMKATEVFRKAWYEEKEIFLHNANRMNCDFKDTLQVQKDEVLRLTNDNRRLELQKTALSMDAWQHQADEFACVRKTFNECEQMRKELSAIRQTNTILEEKIENIAKQLQQERDRWNKQYELEKVAQVQLQQAQIDLSIAEEKIAQRDERICDLVEDLQACNDPSNTNRHRLDASMKSVLESDELHIRIRTPEQECADLRKESNKHKVEATGHIMESHIKEAKLLKVSAEHNTLLQAAEACGYELQWLRAAVERGKSGLSQEQRNKLVIYIDSLTSDKQALLYKVKELTDERDELRNNKTSVEAAAQRKVDEVRKAAVHWYTSYWDFAVNKVEKLQEELDLKNGRLPPPRTERNPRVADRAALRTACEGEGEGTESIDPCHLPLEYYEPGFEDGRIVAAMDALRVLRLMGWEAVDDMKKVWLEPLYKPFLVKDAAKYLDKQQRQVLQQVVAFGETHSVKPQMPRVKPMTLSRRPPPQSSAEVYRVPAYESWLSQYDSMMREKWDALEADNKLDFVEMFLPGGSQHPSFR